MSEPNFLRAALQKFLLWQQTKRQADGEDLYFIINFKDEEIPLPAVFDGKEDILTGEKVQGGEMLKKYDLRIVSVPRA